MKLNNQKSLCEYDKEDGILILKSKIKGLDKENNLI